MHQTQFSLCGPQGIWISVMCYCCFSSIHNTNILTKVLQFVPELLVHNVACRACLHAVKCVTCGISPGRAKQCDLIVILLGAAQFE